MGVSLSRVWGVIAVVAWLTCGQFCPCATAQPGIKELRASADPTLIKGRTYDLAFCPMNQASQEKAAAAYEFYLESHPQSELAPFLYYHLARMFVPQATFREQLGFKTDKKRASRYFELSMKSYPKGKISWLRSRAYVCYASMAETEEEKLQRYTEYYEWLQSLDRDQIEEQIWLPPDASNAFKNSEVGTFLKNREAAYEVAAHNMAAIATQVDGVETLEKLSADFQGSKLAKVADQRIAKLIENSRRAESVAPRSNFWVILLVNAVGFGGLLVAYYWHRRTRQITTE
tara:strand:+ start:15219 stop:16082 length:864 start_codon:yes stop_codon:yes gene_type:complete